MTNASVFTGAGLSTPGLALRVAAGPHFIQQLTLLADDDPLLKTDVARGFPFDLTFADRVLRGDTFQITALHSAEKLLIVSCVAEDIETRLTWSVGHASALHMLVQLRTLPAGAILDGTLDLSILDRLHPGPLDRSPMHGAGSGPLTTEGRPLVRTGKYILPWWWSSDTAGIAVIDRHAPDVSFGATWQPARRLAPVRVRNEWITACELVLMPCGPGWLGAFTAWRQQLRAGMDLSEYERPDFSWYSGQWVQHFTFMYGREIMDHASGRLDLERLLDDGLRFGGYDGILLWPGYPRLGVDERTQFDLYDDLPGGRAGIRELAAHARARGTRVFIPYLPWDMPPDARHGSPAGAPRALASAVADMDVDGVFLDTMGSIRPQFRQSIDAVRAGVVFCSEIQPGGDVIPRITGSWDQASHQHAGEVDLLRFLFPEHPSFMISRHAIGAHREQVIARALFNGTGLVVWQDVFGEVLPYTDRQATLVRDTAALLRCHADCFRGAECFPLIPTTDPSIIANCFTAHEQRAVITACNVGSRPVRGDLVAWQPRDADRFRWRRVGLGSREESAASSHWAAEYVPSGLLNPGETALFVGEPGA
jgi:hypothetical protein